MDRNYLPIKMDCFRPNFSEKLPAGTGQVSEFQEITPGVWLPSRIGTVSYSPPATKEGRSMMTWRMDMVLEKANLNPMHRPEFFRVIQFTQKGL